MAGFSEPLAHHETSEELRRADLILRAQHNASPDGMLLVDPSGAIISCNQRFRELWGAPRELFDGNNDQPVLEFVVNQVVDPQHFLERVQYLYANASLSSRDVVRLKNGTVFDRFSSPVTTSDGEHLGRVWHFHDITELQKTQDELKVAKEAAEAAAAAKSEFLAHITHEIRTPINGVIGMTNLLRQTPLDADQQRYADLAQQSAEALLNVINDILDFSRIEGGDIELSETEFSVRDVIETTLSLAAPRAFEKDIEVICDADANLPGTVLGDPSRLRQVLGNLTSNAIKFTPRGEMVVSASIASSDASSTLIKFSVRDTGIGISPDGIGKLFQSFSQIESSNTRRFGGAGLGLAISKKLVELMNGEIGVESEQGKGSTFWFTSKFSTAQECPPPRWVDGVARLRGLRVLVATLNPTLSRAIAAQLAGWSMETRSAAAREEVIHQLRSAGASGLPLDVLLLDKGLGIDPSELQCGAMASGQENPAVIWLTDPCSKSDDADAQSQENHRLVKPIRQGELAGVLIQVTAARSGAAADATGAKSTTPAIRVLVAEDNPINQIVAAKSLEPAGFVCDLANDGVQAVDAVLKAPYDVILMDCQMPEMDGLEATRRIRALEMEGRIPSRTPGSGARRLPIIALTASAIKGDREHCLEAGMDDYITKPFALDHVLKTIRKYLDPAAPIDPAQGAFGQEAAGGEQASSDQLPAKEEDASPRPSFVTFNYDTLLERCMGDKDLLLTLATTFDSQAHETISRLQQALEGGNIESVRREAHSLKGAASYLSAELVRAAALQLEQQAAKNLQPELPKSLEQVKQQVEACLVELSQLRNGAQALSVAADGPITEQI